MAASSFVLLSSCKADDVLELPANDSVVVGLYAGGSSTRTEMLENGLSAQWVSGDELSLWATNSSGSYTLSNQKFSVYGADASKGFFTSTLSSAMAEGTYTYYCTYPRPVSVSGTKVTFSIPDQQNGKATDGADVMIATPAQGGPLSEISVESSYEPVAMTMNRMMHQFRFWFEQDGYQNENVERIMITMPDNIVGNVVFDYADLSATMTVPSGAKNLTLILDEPLVPVSDISEANFACASVIPYYHTCDSDDFMYLTAYTANYKYILDPISLDGRSFQSGHSTPVRLDMTSPQPFKMMTLKVNENYIGESLWNIQIVSNGTVLYNYANTSGKYSHIVHQEEFVGETNVNAYNEIINAINNGTAVYRFETNNALVEHKITSDMLAINGNYAVLDLGDVPYLLYEDFSSAKASEHNDAYTPSANSDRNNDGYLLNDYMPQTGWNASRYRIFAGDCIRINCRYQSGGWVVERMCGRLDTPALKYLKSGASVTVVVEYDKAFYIPIGYALGGDFNDSANKVARFHVGKHTTSEGSTIDGLLSGDISGMTFTSGLYASESVAQKESFKTEIPSAGPSTRIVFMADTTRDTKHIGQNSCYFLYLDNIKVYIKGN